MLRKIRSRHFVTTGAIGGFLGFAGMEMLATPARLGAISPGGIAHMGLYFAGFGLAVGALLGMTEGLFRRQPARLAYGVIVGLLLGAVGGAVGGVLGQALFGLLPIRYAGRSTIDLAIVLDSSGSMKQLFFWGNDPWGQRKEAARELIDRLAPTDRVAVIDFDEKAVLLHPLRALDSGEELEAARRAVGEVDSTGGTDLTAGLSLAVEVLESDGAPERERFIIFLTDGMGAFDPGVVERARSGSITIYTVGLGSEIDAALLDRSIARPTGGEYFAVGRAADLAAVFERIYTERIDMVSRVGEAPTPEAQLLTSPITFLFFRIGSWALMGLVIGLGQGVRENTREDFRACGFGGFLGGLVGGGLFEPVSSFAGLAGGALGRLLADVLVGACIGGSMRLAQERFVDALPKTTRLSLLLPKKEDIKPVRPRPSFTHFHPSGVEKK